MAREHILELLESLFTRRREAVHLHDIWAQSLRSADCRKTVRAVGLIHGVRSLELLRSAQLMGGSLQAAMPAQPPVGWRLQTTLAAVRGDRAIMRRLEDKQTQLVQAYAEALANPSAKPVRRVLERHLAEEQRHLAWLGHRRSALRRPERRRAVA
jgi:hypothetical protein